MTKKQKERLESYQNNKMTKPGDIPKLPQTSYAEFSPPLTWFWIFLLRTLRLLIVLVSVYLIFRISRKRKINMFAKLLLSLLVIIISFVILWGSIQVFGV